MRVAFGIFLGTVIVIVLISSIIASSRSSLIPLAHIPRIFRKKLISSLASSETRSGVVRFSLKSRLVFSLQLKASAIFVLPI